MKESHALALIVAYYLSKFDRIAYEQLGFKSIQATHDEVALLLDVKPNSVKNMRDGFDPIHDNNRVGWYQRPLRPSRAKVVDFFQNLSEEELRDVVFEILTNPSFAASEDFNEIVAQISEREKGHKGKTVFIVRGPTGRKAEELFMGFHEAHAVPEPGELRDARDLGCGYDFALSTDSGLLQIEVKGLDGDSGGLTFTSKEWDTARKQGNKYYLVIVRNVSSEPSFQIIQNPIIFFRQKNQFLRPFRYDGV